MTRPSRRQLPPQIRKISVTNRRTGKAEPRYEVTVDTGLDENGKRHQSRRRFTTEQAARSHLATVQADVARGVYVRTRATTVQDACENWLASKHRLKESTKQGHRSKFKALWQRVGSKPVQQLTQRDLDDVVRALLVGEGTERKAWSPRSVNYLLTITAQVLDAELKQGHVVRNVARLVDRIPQQRAEMRTLSTTDMHRVLDHRCREQHLWVLALHGLRRGEIAGLRWSDVDFESNRLTIAETRVEGERGEVHTTTPKSLSSRRTLPMPPDVVAALKRAKKAQARERLALGAEHGPGLHVAVDEAGRPYKPNWITDAWERLLRDLGIERVRLHDARHTCATVMHLQGVPTAVIAAWLGHADSSFTLRTYAHSQPDALVAAAVSLRGVPVEL
ncbi:site-specific integrase [Tsukamurella strandjordii]|uniref:Site-specific integrase n=1 Tax=Tsukamurella strandjordii TaxID=147577 RepID=A0AA90NBZ4_9ACTN|nr:site-specific integrase [Tsukamurella strandjordii]MDP0398935.1 site-specific integrase [Tsukamurella strandjordii]